jgi:hypothetical protein
MRVFILNAGRERRQILNAVDNISDRNLVIEYIPVRNGLDMPDDGGGRFPALRAKETPDRVKQKCSDEQTDEDREDMGDRVHPLRAAYLIW